MSLDKMTTEPLGEINPLDVLSLQDRDATHIGDDSNHYIDKLYSTSSLTYIIASSPTLDNSLDLDPYESLVKEVLRNIGLFQKNLVVSGASAQKECDGTPARIEQLNTERNELVPALIDINKKIKEFSGHGVSTNDHVMQLKQEIIKFQSEEFNEHIKKLKSEYSNNIEAETRVIQNDTPLTEQVLYYTLLEAVDTVFAYPQRHDTSTYNLDLGPHIFSLQSLLKKLEYNRFIDPMSDDFTSLFNDFSQDPNIDIDLYITNCVKKMLENDTKAATLEHTGNKPEKIKAELDKLEQDGCNAFKNQAIDGKIQEYALLISGVNSNAAKLSGLKVEKLELQEKLQAWKTKLMKVEVDQEVALEFVAKYKNLSEDLKDSILDKELPSPLEINKREVASYTTTIIKQQQEISKYRDEVYQKLAGFDNDKLPDEAKAILAQELLFAVKGSNLAALYSVNEERDSLLLQTNSVKVVIKNITHIQETFAKIDIFFGEAPQPSYISKFNDLISGMLKDYNDKLTSLSEQLKAANTKYDDINTKQNVISLSLAQESLWNSYYQGHLGVLQDLKMAIQSRSDLQKEQDSVQSSRRDSDDTMNRSSVSSLDDSSEPSSLNGSVIIHSDLDEGQYQAQDSEDEEQYQEQDSEDEGKNNLSLDDELELLKAARLPDNLTTTISNVVLSEAEPKAAIRIIRATIIAAQEVLHTDGIVLSDLGELAQGISQIIFEEATKEMSAVEISSLGQRGHAVSFAVNSADELNEEDVFADVVLSREAPIAQSTPETPLVRTHNRSDVTIGGRNAFVEIMAEAAPAHEVVASRVVPLANHSSVTAPVAAPVAAPVVAPVVAPVAAPIAAPVAAPVAGGGVVHVIHHPALVARVELLADKVLVTAPVEADPVAAARILTSIANDDGYEEEVSEYERANSAPSPVKFANDLKLSRFNDSAIDLSAGYEESYLGKDNHTSIIDSQNDDGVDDTYSSIRDQLRDMSPEDFVTRITENPYTGTLSELPFKDPARQERPQFTDPDQVNKDFVPLDTTKAKGHDPLNAFLAALRRQLGLSYNINYVPDIQAQ